MFMENKMYVIREVAKELRVTYRSMQRYIADKKINAVKIGNKWMISQRELNYIKKNGLREPVSISIQPINYEELCQQINEKKD